MSAITIQKLGYSRSPWRLIDGAGNELRFESVLTNIHGADQYLDVCGYDTKAEAIEALGRLAALLIAQLQRSAA